MSSMGDGIHTSTFDSIEQNRNDLYTTAYDRFMRLWKIKYDRSQLLVLTDDLKKKQEKNNRSRLVLAKKTHAIFSLELSIDLYDSLDDSRLMRERLEEEKIEYLDLLTRIEHKERKISKDATMINNKRLKLKAYLNKRSSVLHQFWPEYNSKGLSLNDDKWWIGCDDTKLHIPSHLLDRESGSDADKKGRHKSDDDEWWIWYNDKAPCIPSDLLDKGDGNENHQYRKGKSDAFSGHTEVQEIDREDVVFPRGNVPQWLSIGEKRRIQSKNEERHEHTVGWGLEKQYMLPLYNIAFSAEPMKDGCVVYNINGYGFSISNPRYPFKLSLLLDMHGKYSLSQYVIAEWSNGVASCDYVFFLLQQMADSMGMSIEQKLNLSSLKKEKNRPFLKALLKWLALLIDCEHPIVLQVEDNEVYALDLKMFSLVTLEGDDPIAIVLRG